MSAVQNRFQEIVDKIASAPDDGSFSPSNDLKLKMYGLFSQATKGDVSGKRPGMLDVVGRFKYDAWAANKGMSREDAMQGYIEIAEGVARENGWEV